VRGQDLKVRIWSPGDRELPLLIAHDGPEYDALASLTRYAGAMIERGALPPFRIALLPPGERDEWYSASAVYGRSLSQRIVPALCGELPVTGDPVGMGASLGAVAMLQAQRAWSGTFSGLFLQSGSFLVPRLIAMRRPSPATAVSCGSSEVCCARAHTLSRYRRSMTCGAEEENVHNNRLMAAALSAHGRTLVCTRCSGCTATRAGATRSTHTSRVC
jgi:enterochelin esterase-like enzyme